MTTVNVTGTDLELIMSWLSLWQGVIGYTNREKELLGIILLRYSYLKGKGLIEPYLFKELFSTESRKHYCEVMDITSYNLTNLISSLKEKGVIMYKDLNPKIIPQKEITFKFKYDAD